MNKLWENIRSTITGALRDTPVEVAIAVVCGVLASIMIEDHSFMEEETLAKIALTAVLALCAVFATSASHTLKVFDGRTRWLLTGVFGVGLTVYGATVLDPRLATEMWRWAFLGIASVMGVMLVPVAARIGDVSASERFWRYNIRLFSRVAVAYSYGLLLFVGLAIGAGSVDALFDVSFDEVYGHLAVWVILVLGTILAVGSLGEVKKIGHAFAPETLVWSGRLGTFLFIPLVLLYLAIMYAYLGKVLVTGELPSNVLSPLALGAGMLGYFGLFVLQPHMHREDFKPLAWVLRAFPAAFIVVVPFGVFAVWERVAQYGWTEFRYARMAALICLGVFSIAGAFKWIRKQEFSLVTGPAILGVVSLLGAVGPWGASNVSMLSQQSRLEEALVKADMSNTPGKLPSPEILAVDNAEQAETIRAAARYLVETHGGDAIAPYSDLNLSNMESFDQIAALGISEHRVVSNYISLHADRSSPFYFERGGMMTDFGASEHTTDTTRGIELRIKDGALLVSYGDKQGSARPQFEATQDGEQLVNGPLADADRVVPVLSEDGVEIGAVGLRDVTLLRENETSRITYISGIVVMY